MITLHSNNKPIKAAYTLKHRKRHGGAEAVFIKLNDRIGIKIYKTRGQRNRAYDRQKKAFLHGLGPRVGRKIKLDQLFNIGDWPYQRKIKVGDMVYGYLTHIAKSIYSNDCSHNQMREVRTKLKKIGLGGDVERSCNFGWIGDNLVLIDFGDACVSNEIPAFVRKKLFG